MACLNNAIGDEPLQHSGRVWLFFKNSVNTESKTKKDNQRCQQGSSEIVNIARCAHH